MWLFMAYLWVVVLAVIWMGGNEKALKNQGFLLEAGGGVEPP